MVNDKSLDFLDFLILIVKWKWLLIILMFCTLGISYVAIYYFIPEQFDAKVLIIPAEQDQMSGFSSLLKGFSSLPISGLGGISKNKSADLYNTIIYSRTNLEKIVKKFDLIHDYKLKSLEQTVKALKSNIKTVLTDENAYDITVRASSPQKAADIANFLVDKLNESVIELNTARSKDNRIFMEQRYTELKKNLKQSEDSLKKFQETSGMVQAEGQLKAIIENYSNLEAELGSKQIELVVLEKLYGKDAPQIKQLKLTVDELKQKVEKFKSSKDPNEGLMLPLNSLPEKSLTYFRLYRDVKVFNTMLEFIIPMYEQAKFDEKKDFPILQVIDRAVPPEKRAYPQRTLFALAISLIVLIFTIICLTLRELLKNSTNPKVDFIKKGLSPFSQNKISRV